MKRNRITAIISLALILILSAALLASCAPNTPEAPEITPETIADALPDWQHQFDLGMRFLSQGNYQEAIIAFTAVIEIAPRNAEALVGRGTAHILWQEDLAAARADFELALEIDERNADAWLGLVDIYIRVGEFDRALEIARRGYELTGDAALHDMVQALESGTVRDSEGRVRRSRHYEGGEFVFYALRSYVQGRWTTITTIDPAGNVIAHGDIIHDERGNMLTFFAPMGSGRMERVERTYNDAGQRIRSDQFSSIDGRFFQFFLYEYGADGVRTRSIRHNSDGTMVGYTLFNSQGLPERISQLDRDGQLTSYAILEHDFEGRVIRSANYWADGTLNQVGVWEYDDAGNLISETWYNADGTVVHQTIFE